MRRRPSGGPSWVSAWHRSARSARVGIDREQVRGARWRSIASMTVRRAGVSFDSFQTALVGDSRSRRAGGSTMWCGTTEDVFIEANPSPMPAATNESIVMLSATVMTVAGATPARSNAACTSMRIDQPADASTSTRGSSVRSPAATAFASANRCESGTSTPRLVAPSRRRRRPAPVAGPPTSPMSSLSSRSMVRISGFRGSCRTPISRCGWSRVSTRTRATSWSVAKPALKPSRMVPYSRCRRCGPIGPA